MAKREIKVSSVDQTIDIFVPDSSSTVGAGLSGLVYNSAGLTCYYRKGATGSATQLSLATLATVGTAHADGGFKEIDATNMKGVYRLDLSDTMVDTAGILTICLLGATNMAQVLIEIEVVAINKYDSVRGGMTALPNAAADAAGGLPISDAGGLDLDALNTAAVRLTAPRAQAIDDLIDGGRLDLILDAILADTGTDGVALSSAAIAAILDLSNGIETGITLRQAMRLILAAEAGKLSGAATTTIVIRNAIDTKARITATVDSDGNRSAVTLDAT